MRSASAEAALSSIIVLRLIIKFILFHITRDEISENIRHSRFM
jgi:hypothetical protein